MLRKVILSLILGALIPLGLFAYTTVSGDVSGQIWTGGVIYVQSSVSVSSGTNLTIMPGTVVKFHPGTRMDVMGGLIANGSISGQIIFTSWLDDGHGGDSNGDGSFTSPAPNDWSGVNISNASVAPQIQYCQFLYGAYASGWMLNIQSSPAGYVRHSEFRYSQNYGLQIYGCDQSVEDCVFADNLGTGAVFSLTGGNMVINNNSFLGNLAYAAQFNTSAILNFNGNTLISNRYNCFRFDDCKVTGTVSWPNSYNPVVNGLQINTGNSLLIAPGAVIKNFPAWWFVQGTLSAIGTAQAPIVFTSWQDDTHGGDTNADGSATSPAPNQWGGVQLYQSASGPAFDYCEFYYGAYGTGWLLNIFNAPSGYIRNCRFAYSQNYGLNINSISAEITGCTFDHNLNSGLSIANTGTGLILNNNVFTDNGAYAALLSNCAITNFSGNLLTNNLYNSFLLEGCKVQEDIIWPNSYNPLVNGLQIYPGKTLQITPGAVIKNLTGYWFVQGNLIANGTAAQPIVFTSWQDDTHGGDSNADGSATSPAPNQWGGIQIYASTAGPAFDYCEFYYGAYGTGWLVNVYNAPSGYIRNCRFAYSQNLGLSISSQSAEITGCTFDHNLNSGLSIANTGTGLILNNNVITQNGAYAALLSNCAVTNFSGNLLSNNLYNVFRLDGCTISGVVQWTNDVTLFVNGLTIPAGASLNISPGTLIKSSSGYWFVQGTLVAAGTQQTPIVFTSWLDDGHGGDSNADASATTPAPNQWGGVQFYQYTSGYALDYCEFYYGANGTGWLVNIYNAPAGYIRHCTFKYSQNYGISIINSSPTLRNNIIADNFSVGVMIEGSSQPSLGENTPDDYGRNVFSNNHLGNFQMQNSSNNIIHAYGNFWSWDTAPLIDAHLYDNEENNSYGEILFSPWLTDSPRIPQIIEFYYTPDGIGISWEAVIQSELGNPVTISLYRVEMSADPYASDPEWQIIGSLPGTSGLITGPAFEAQKMFFRVIAISE